MEYYGNNDYRDYLALTHHGILGMKWGRRNGPPYPLGASDHSASEKKAGWRKSLGDGDTSAIASKRRYIDKQSKKAIKRYKKDIKKADRAASRYEKKFEKYHTPDSKRSAKIEERYKDALGNAFYTQELRLKELDRIRGLTEKDIKEEKRSTSALKKVPIKRKTIENRISKKRVGDSERNLLKEQTKKSADKIVDYDKKRMRDIDEGLVRKKDFVKDMGFGKGRNSLSSENLSKNKKIKEAFDDPKLTQLRNKRDKAWDEYNKAGDVFDNDEKLHKKYAKLVADEKERQGKSRTYWENLEGGDAYTAAFEKYMETEGKAASDQWWKATNEYNTELRKVSERIVGDYKNKRVETGWTSRYRVGGTSEAELIVESAIDRLDKRKQNPYG